MKNLWQITLPLSVVIIFSIAAFTTIHMVNGRYLFDLELNPKNGLKMKTDVDKRENPTPARQDPNKSETATK